MRLPDQHNRLERCVKEIVDLMCDGKWHAGRSHLEIMEREGVAHGTVIAWASKASNFLRLSDIFSAEDLRTKILAGIDANQALCLNKQSTFKGVKYDTPDLQTHLKGLELRARVYGLLENKRAEPEKESIKLAELVRLLEANGYDVRRKDGFATGAAEEPARADTGADGEQRSAAAQTRDAPSECDADNPKGLEPGS